MTKKTANKVEDAELSPKTSADSSPEREVFDAPFKDIEALAFETRKERKRRRNQDGDAASLGSASETLMSKHVLNMGFYAINMGECDPGF